jgi:hypothetical protein
LYIDKTSLLLSSSLLLPSLTTWGNSAPFRVQFRVATILRSAR